MPRVLVHVAGSERCILSYRGCPSSQTILEIRIQRGGISIQGPTIWAVPGYLDDWLILAQSEAVSTSHKTLLISYLVCLGIRVNFSKSILSRSQRVSFLGTVIDSVQMTATVSAERATMIHRHAASFKELKELISAWHCCKCCAVIVRRAGLPCMQHGWHINTRSYHLGCPWLPALLRDAWMQLSPLCDRWDSAY